MHIVIIGGGVAGTSCAEQLSYYAPKASVTVVAATDIVKSATSTHKLTEHVNALELLEHSQVSFESLFENVRVRSGVVESVQSQEQTVKFTDGTFLNYDRLCICTGASANIAETLANHPYVVAIRDTDTSKALEQRLSGASKILVVGDGGIAMELVFEVINCEIVWCIKHQHIGTHFFDEGAAEFLSPAINNKTASKDETQVRKADTLVFKRKKFVASRERLKENAEVTGSALGPDWCQNKNLKGTLLSKRKVTLKYNCELSEIIDPPNEQDSKRKNVYAKLTNGETVGCDFIVYATGVSPTVPTISEPVNLFPEGGILVDDNMQTSIGNIYAAGDCCIASWDHAEHWFQMNLWTQAWQMGAFAGRCIAQHVNDPKRMPLDFCFELFTHTTTFFGFKVVLLGCYNAQKLQDYELMLRCTPGVEYVKLVMRDGRIQGATLIGETDLEETIENLILNQTDVAFLGESLLDPDVDIEDYFD